MQNIRLHVLCFIWTLLWLVFWFLLPFLTPAKQWNLGIGTKRTNQEHWTNICYFFMKSIRKYSSCELRPQQDFSFRLMCFKSFSEGNLYLLTCHKTRRMVNVTEYDHNSLSNIELHPFLAQNHSMPTSIAINKVCYRNHQTYIQVAISMINLYPGIYCI